MIKILPADKTRYYELTYLITADLTQADQQKIHQEIIALTKKHHALVVHQENWGKKSLAYKIRHGFNLQSTAVYKFLILEINADDVNDLAKDLYLNDNLMRHLLISTTIRNVKEIKTSPNALIDKNDLVKEESKTV